MMRVVVLMVMTVMTVMMVMIAAEDSNQYQHGQYLLLQSWIVNNGQKMMGIAMVMSIISDHRY